MILYRFLIAANYHTLSSLKQHEFVILKCCRLEVWSRTVFLSEGWRGKSISGFSFWSKGFPGGSAVKNPPANKGDAVRSLGHEHPLEKEMATHSSILAWRIPWRERPGGLLSMGSQRVRHEGATNTFTFSSCLKSPSSDSSLLEG